jgi:hypothetical protein
MDTKLQRYYRKARKAGYHAKGAYYAAKIMVDWSQPEADELVKIEAEPEYERYVDVYGEMEAYTNIFGKRISKEQAEKDMADLVERSGVWCVCSYYRVTDDDEWQLADSIGMCTGYHDVCD